MRRSLIPLMLLTAGSAASAQTLSWSNASGGSAGLTTNWSPGQVPNSSNPLVFNIASALSTIPITFPLIANDSLSHTYKQESWTLTCSAVHSIGTGGISVAVTSNETATLILTTGSMNTAGLLSMSTGFDTIATLAVDDDDAALAVTGVGLSEIGFHGVANVTIAGGGLLSFVGGLRSSFASDGSTTIGVSGQAGAPSLERSRILNDGDLLLSVSGTTNLVVFDGALVDIEGDLHAAAAGNLGTATITVEGAGVLDDASIDVAGDCLLAYNTTGVISSGAATLNLNDDSRLDVGGDLVLGGDAQGGNATFNANAGSLAFIDGTIRVAPDNGVGNGTLHLNGGAVTTNSLFVGADGILNLDSGTLVIDAGTWTHSTLLPGMTLGSPGAAVVAIRNGAVATLTQGSGAVALTAGGGTAGADNADLRVESDADLLIAAGDVVIASGATDDDCRITVTGPGSSMTTPASAFVKVADAGTGELFFESGASGVLGRVRVGVLPGSVGSFLVSDPGTSVTIESFELDGSISADGGVGVLSVLSGGVLTVSDGGFEGEVRRDGEVVVNAAELHHASDIDVSAGGEVSVDDGGVIDCDALNLASDASNLVSRLSLNMSGLVKPDMALVQCEIDMGEDAEIEVGPGGGRVGDPNAILGFESEPGGTIRLHGNELIIDDKLTAFVGNIILSDSGGPGGTLTGPPTGMFLGVGSDLSGTGSVVGKFNIQSTSSVTTASGTQGITFEGLLTNTVGAPISGVIQFMNGGGYEGAGTIDGRVIGDANAVYTATGDLTMGDETSTSGFASGGWIFTGGHIVVLEDSFLINLPSVELAAGTLASTTTLNVSSEALLQGVGTVVTTQLTLFGAARPGDFESIGSDIGILQSAGHLTFKPGSTYLCHIGPGVEFPVSDAIKSSTAGKNAIIEGGLLDVDLLPGYVPEPSDFFDVVVATASVAGAFDTLSLPPKAAVRYLPDRVRVHFCYADCESDGDLDVFDFLCFQNFFASGNMTADCELDGDLDVFDFLCFQNEFAAGCGF